MDIKQEYQYQLFGMRVETVIMGCQDVVEEVIAGALADLKKKLLPKYDQQALTELIALLEKEFQESMKRNRYQIEEAVRNTLTIPDHVLLPGDEAMGEEYPPDYEQCLDENIRNAERRLIAMTYVQKNIAKMFKAISEKTVHNLKVFVDEVTKDLPSSDSTVFTPRLLDLQRNLLSSLESLSLTDTNE